MLGWAALALGACGGGGGNGTPAAPAQAPPTSQAPSGPAVELAALSGSAYVLAGHALKNVGGMQVDIAYDPAKLANPRVTQGAMVTGGAFVVNTNLAGEVRIALVTSPPLAGDGTLATLSFDQAAGTTGGIMSVAVSVYDQNGAVLPISIIPPTP
ncbi:hypothetical protein GPICK_12045 [Geobacter pickeringii]|uniref:Cohesin domain-containing protein n=1 Tax=Geobacter pickeringii TaxID=345632 RepID=A0A0B5BB44_9BACT|nr:hypothetical protein GPICK_12045 [Geobacter pickeringii]